MFIQIYNINYTNNKATKFLTNESGLCDLFKILIISLNELPKLILYIKNIQ